MYATIYGRGQMVIPAKARKEARLNTGDIVHVSSEGDGRLVLLRLEKPKPAQKKYRLRRSKAGHLVISGVGKKIMDAEIKKALAEFP
jgi:AbrB family looped-hinge helix DNA binding protein